MATVKCRAADSSKCRFHGNPARVEAFQLYQKHVIERVKNGDQVSAFDVAYASDLTYDGPVPKWFKKLSKERGKDKFAGCTPELLGEVDSPLGKLLVAWQDTPAESKTRGLILDSGYNVRVCEYRKADTGEVVGYVRVSNVDDVSLERSYGSDEFSEFRFLERYGGLSAFDDYTDDPNDERWVMAGNYGLQGEELLAFRRKLWLQARRVSMLQDDVSPVYGEDGVVLREGAVTEKHVPSDEQVLDDLTRYRAVVREHMNVRKKDLSVHFIDYSHVNDRLKGKGFGSALYVFAAKRLAAQGSCLRGASSQTPAAQKVWAQFTKNFPEHSGKTTVSWNGSKNTYPTLDFR